MFIQQWFQQKREKKIGFEDVMYAIIHSDDFLIINTLDKHMQQCLIKNTIHVDIEEKTINDLMNQSTINKKIILYGKNSGDDSVYKKYNQLVELGFQETYIYGGGLFEWLLLQDIYSENEFPTTSKVDDFLFYKQIPQMHIPRLK
tara:strand:- start:308 stop:742 length:435 start_codon:yes stop_codon:yes gene_type:complete